MPASKKPKTAAEPKMGPKYEFTGEVKVSFGITLRRIRAVTAIGFIAAGTLGGWIEREENLSQVFGNAWVSGNARVGRRITCATRSDGYTFTLATDRKTGRPVIIAGCRYFDFEAARRHWQATRAGTPLGDETFAILDMLEQMSVIRGPEPDVPADASDAPDAAAPAVAA